MSFPATFYALLRNQQYLTVVGATTETYSDKTIYDGTTYRDDPVQLLNVPLGAIDPDTDRNQSLRDTYIGSASLVAAGVADPVSHTAPRFEAKKRTMIVWTNGADTVGECWADQFVGISSSVPRFVQ